MAEQAREFAAVLPDEEATFRLGAALGRILWPQAQRAPEALMVWLLGDLGAGKTTLVRGLLRSRGYAGPVRSPTFTIVEPYTVDDLAVYHFDLYRLADPEELLYMGARDYFAASGLCLVEWPDRGGAALPAPALEIKLEVLAAGRRVVIKSREISITLLHELHLAAP